MHCLQACASLTMGKALSIHWIRVAKHLQGPMIHSLLLIFDRIIFNLNTFGRKVIVVYERIPAENMKSIGLWVRPKKINCLFLVTG